jgi:osomolarity two-component system, sensor histidine kinase SLN1
MRIPIREQLAGFLLITSLVPLAVLAIATWINNHNFVTGITSNSLSLAASLKATQIASDLLLIQATCSTIVTRVLLQDALKTYYRGDKTPQNWADALPDVKGALRSGGFASLLQ